MSKLMIFRRYQSVLNIHECALSAPADVAAQLLASLAGDEDRFWPWEYWPPMKLDSGLQVGSRGGHSMIRYRVTEYIPGRRVEFEFEPMEHLHPFRGRHYFELIARSSRIVLRHTIDVETNFSSWIYWKIFIERIHDAVIEDAFDKAERHAGVQRPQRSHWSLYVRFLRWRRSRKMLAARA
jgi:hypothetical protein